MHNILLSGYYGMGNFGDDLFACVSRLGVQKYWSIPSTAVRVLPNYAATAGRFNSFAERMYSSPSSCSALVRRLALFHNVARVDYVLFAGGSLFSSRNSLRCRLQAIKFGRKLGVRFAAIGVSFGPLLDASSMALLSEIIKELEFVSVRDEISASLLDASSAKAKLVRSSDLAGVAIDLGFPRNVPCSENIALVPMNARNSVYQDQTLARYLQSAACNAAKASGRTLDVICVNSGRIHSDQNISRDWVQQARQSVHTALYIHDEVMTTWNRIAGAKCLITYRLHPAIVAYLCGVPFVLIEYHEKCRAFLDMIRYPKELRLSPKEQFQSVQRVVRTAADTGVPAGLLPVAEYVEMATRSFSDVPWRANDWR